MILLHFHNTIAMKTRLSILAAAFILLSFASLRAQTADDIINKHIDAIGGKAAWQNINSFRLTTSITMQGTDIPIIITALQNKGARMDMTMMGMSGYTINTPTEGWSFMPMFGQQKPEAMTPDQVKAGQDQLDIQGELIDYKAKGYTAELVGKEDVEGTECWKIKLNMKNGKVRTEFFDPDSYLLIRQVDKVTVDGKEQESTTDFSNFQKLPEGVTMPMAVNNGGMGEAIIKKIEINIPVADSTFKVSQQ
jgi:hypothetical protein